MKDIIRLISLTLALVFCMSVPVFADDDVVEITESGKSYSIPIVLSVYHSNPHIDVTVPASLPISVTDGKVLTADNLRIVNNSTSSRVQITKVEAVSGTLSLTSYESFPARGDNLIALRVNGCGTNGDGPLAINDLAFPVINSSGSLPIKYNAKVNVARDMTDISAASIVFTLKAI